jgi:hypothetical protein
MISSIVAPCASAAATWRRMPGVYRLPPGNRLVPPPSPPRHRTRATAQTAHDALARPVKAFGCPVFVGTFLAYPRCRNS